MIAAVRGSGQGQTHTRNVVLTVLAGSGRGGEACDPWSLLDTDQSAGGSPMADCYGVWPGPNNSTCAACPGASLKRLSQVISGTWRASASTTYAAS